MGLTAQPVLLLRHARAGSRSAWRGDDRDRPLDERGMRQAAALPDRLARFAIRRVLTSPSLRCVQTVEPLADSLRLPVEHRDALAEGAVDAHRLLEELGDGGALLCTHGDVIAALIGSERKAAKGSVWVLDTGAQFTPVRYLKPKI